jgi:hypothetical protein
LSAPEFGSFPAPVNLYHFLLYGFCHGHLLGNHGYCCSAGSADRSSYRWRSIPDSDPGCCLTGAIFGDHCSPLSDTTILSSTGAGSDHIDHVRTQIPYALTAAVVSGVFGFIPAGLGVHPVISIILGLVVLIVFVKLVGKPTGSAELIAGSKK